MKRVTYACLALSLPDRCLFSSSTPSRGTSSLPSLRSAASLSLSSGPWRRPCQGCAAPAAPGPAHPQPLSRPCPATTPAAHPATPVTPAPVPPLKQGEGQGGQAGVPGHRLPESGQNPGLRRQDHPWGIRRVKLLVVIPAPESLRPCSSQSVLLPVTYRALSSEKLSSFPTSSYSPREPDLHQACQVRNAGFRLAFIR